jgi:ABC-2 type transport system ATP-binding protein
MPLIEMRGVERRFGDLVALRGLDLSVERGEVLGLIGPNGAGKTTALRILTGLLEPSAGSVRIDGLDVQREPLAAKRRFGFVPDGAPLYANLSPMQHLLLVGRLCSLDEEPLRAEARRLLAALELDARADDPVGGFSRGMRQKTALACALLARPPLLILDEPLTGLDAPTAAATKSILRAWADRGGAVLYTSHLLDIVERVCDRIAILAKGELVAVGTLDELRERSHEATLEQIFSRLTLSEDPLVAAQRVLGDAAPATAGQPPPNDSAS